MPIKDRYEIEIKRKGYKIFELEKALNMIPGVKELQDEIKLLNTEIKNMQTEIEDIEDMEAGCY